MARAGEGSRVKGEQRSADQTSRKSSGASYWLIAKNENGRIEVSTVRLPGGEEALAVFGHEEEAELFLWLEISSHSWRIRESSARELISVLYGLCKVVEKVVLDPLPRMLAEKTVGLVSMERERFIDFITIGGRQLDPVIRADHGPQVGAGSLRSGAAATMLTDIESEL
jgi:hypothetical protein